MRPVPIPERSARKRNDRTSVPNGIGPPPTAWMSFGSSPSPRPLSGSLLVIDSKVTAGFASQPSLVSSVAVIWTSLWFGGQRVSGDSETRDVGEHSGGDTVSVAGLLVALPAELLTTTLNSAPLSCAAVAGVV